MDARKRAYGSCGLRRAMDARKRAYGSCGLLDSLLTSTPRTVRSVACGADRLPDALRRRRHVHVLDTQAEERVDNHVHERRRARGNPDLPAALYAKPVAFSRFFHQPDDE